MGNKKNCSCGHWNEVQQECLYAGHGCVYDKKIKEVEKLTDCHDCGAKPGETHEDGCDVERCSVCGGQRLQCNCVEHDKAFARWTGLWPGYAEAELLGCDLNEFTVKRSSIFFIKPMEK